MLITAEIQVLSHSVDKEIDRRGRGVKMSEKLSTWFMDAPYVVIDEYHHLRSGHLCHS